MAEKKSLEAGWASFVRAASPLDNERWEEQCVPAGLALLLAPLEELGLPCCGATGEDDDPAWCGDPFCLQGADLRRQIEELGR